ncbi:protein IQ-DOMAIN 31-like isoform X1 [Ananas comosus]|uniref:Protein IQ-DOMAIN 31-like isoform X1 n=1 Tax=Ananas comosus TaxID=4615 RepID=A0A6P5GKT5_ANACO|nr:protein IQ-DOMAIN 31-like isoform X1 [Ananas comosus]XP_020105911.1 protein IQ-DOMAIN 31-like isoform X1 [Ananas comosus]
MGKSPGKWIKRVLFGKRSSKSRSAKDEGEDSLKNRSDDEGSVGGPGTASDENSFVISDIVLVSNEGVRTIPTLGNGLPSALQGDEAVVGAVSQNGGSAESSNPEYLREEHAAVKAQAAFRGYLARRAFRALKDAVRLQALIRGHLVRRQAIATLRAMHAIVQFQALFRGRSVRRSSVTFEVTTMFWQQKDGKPLDAWRVELSSNAFIYRLLSSMAATNPVHVEYDQGDSNSVFSWLERWTVSQFWKPISQPRKIVDPKSQPKSHRYATKTESAKSKRIAQRHQSATIESGQRNVPRRNARKIATSPVDPERPQTELERVKRNLRKVSNLMTEASEQRVVEDNNMPSSISDIPGKGSDDLSDQARNDALLPPEAEHDKEIALENAATAEWQFDAVNDVSPAVELKPSQSISDAENAIVVNEEEPTFKVEQNSPKAHKMRKRSSFWEIPVNSENTVKKAPILPSYMAATESAKAKLREQVSPGFVGDSVEKNAFTHRHSLPSSTNCKLNSQTPRTGRMILTGNKGVIKSDKSLFSTRDGTDRAIQVGWRR